MEITWRVIGGRRQGDCGGKVEGISSINGTNRQGEVKNSTGNGETKELICTTHGHELRWGPGGVLVGGGGAGQRGKRRRKNGTTVIA